MHLFPFYKINHYFCSMETRFNSRLLEKTVDEFSKLPGIGKKTALRLALHILRKDPAEAKALGEAIIEMRDKINYCSRCHNISEEETCEICSDHRRDQSMVCIVENVKDVITIEATHQYSGLYHVLGGLISPLDGIGPSDIEIESLVERVRNENIEEVILALSPTIEGDTTNFYIFRKLSELPVKITVLARGLSVGNELEYTDELTLGKSIQNRIPFS